LGSYGTVGEPVGNGWLYPEVAGVQEEENYAKKRTLGSNQMRAERDTLSFCNS
jgi:hypothetical protein